MCYCLACWKYYLSQISKLWELAYIFNVVDMQNPMVTKRCCLLNSKTCMLTLDSELTFCVVYWQTKWNNQILNSMLAVLSTVWYLCYWTLKVDISWKFKLMFKLVLLNWIQINYENNQTWTLKFTTQPSVISCYHCVGYVLSNLEMSNLLVTSKENSKRHSKWWGRPCRAQRLQ